MQGQWQILPFYFLIFFLVTTTIETDSGLNRKLPPIDEIEDPPIIKEKKYIYCGCKQKQSIVG